MKLLRKLRVLWARRQDLKRFDYIPDISSHPVIVSLTTVPSRIAHLKPTLLSLLRQSHRPLQIEINLGAFSQAWEIPRWLSALTAVKLFWITPDLGPATKWIPSLRRYPGQDILWVIVDDDMIYPRHLIRCLLAADQVFSGNAAFCVNGHLLPSHLVFFDHPSNRAIKRGRRRVAIMEGCGGYTLRARHFGSDLGILTEMRGAPEGALRQDDIWVSGLLSRCNVPKYQIPVGKRHSLPQADHPALQGPRAEVSNTLLHYFKEEWKPEEIV